MIVSGLSISKGDLCKRRTRRNSYKLKEGRFRLDKRKMSFTLTWVVRHWNMSSRDLVAAALLETFKAKLDWTLI